MRRVKLNLRSLVALLLCELLIWLPIGCSHRVTAPPVPLVPAVFKPLQQDLQRSYLDLFQVAATLEYNEAEIRRMRVYLQGAEDYCVGQFKLKRSGYDKQLEQAQKDLKQRSAQLGAQQRHDMHCQIQELRGLKSQTEVLASHGIPIAYQNKQGKLELIEKWPAQVKEIKQELADGSYRNRRWADVQDIGFREIAAGQEKDIKAGQDAIRQMKHLGLMPHDLEDKAVTEYVNSVAQKVAAKSDLRIPLHVTVLNSKEINAFALPGGFLFVERGLLEAAEDESQLAGVIGHEMAHVVARHSHKLMVKATIASIFYQAAQVAAIVLTGGVAGIGAYYALQYGFYGLGLALNLELLGVSREFELEADQLGIQYTSNSGYDPTGFIRFFDKMATKEGYVNGVSWFRTHPPFYQRMVDAEKEIMFLAKKENLVVETTEFEQMKRNLTKVVVQAKDEEEHRPSLFAPEAGCPPPQKIEYKPDQPIETICSFPTGESAAAK